MPCTTILAGKNATYDGSTMMARNEDSCAGEFTAKKYIVVNPDEQPLEYTSVISKVKIKLPDNPMRYTAMPDAVPEKGIWGEAGINACNVAMSETETITSNARVLGADPLVKGGIGEEDMLTLVLPYIHSAREGVERLGLLLEEYGTYEMNGIGFQDVNEIWWFETIGGHHWMAKRVPDDSYVVMPNQLGIPSFDFKDAFGKKKNHMCSADLVEFVEKYHLDLCEEEEDLRNVTAFDTRAAFGSHSDSDHSYNTPRAWFMERYLNPKTYKWEGPDADFTPESDDLPWSLVPEHKITPEVIKYVLSGYYQGTPYNPYAKHGTTEEQGKYRSIGINRNNFVKITQLRPNLPKEIMGVEWIAVGSNAFNEMVPFYANITKTPEYLANADKTVTTENFYWANRIIGALADAHYSSCISPVERYQNYMAAKGHAFLNETDAAFFEKFCGGKVDGASGKNMDFCQAEVHDFLESANQKMADLAKEKTNDLLDKVLFAASSEMKNAFARSDA